MRSKSSPSTVIYNVGGQYFQVAQTTIRRGEGTFLKSLLDAQAPDEVEPIFVDRNPSFFDYILQWYRDGEILCPAEDEVDVRREMRYFQLPLDAHVRIKRPVQQTRVEVDVEHFSARMHHVFRRALRQVTLPAHTADLPSILEAAYESELSDEVEGASDVGQSDLRTSASDSMLTAGTRPTRARRHPNGRKIRRQKLHEYEQGLTGTMSNAGVFVSD